MASRISLNIHGNNVPNVEWLKTFVIDTQPAALLVLDNLDLARQLKQLVPSCNVIFREYGSQGDGNLYQQSDPQVWLDRHAAQSNGGIMLHVMNEAPFNSEVIGWLTNLLKLAAPRNIPLVIGNWAVGNPLPEQWPMAKELLQLLDQYRKLFALGLHEYAGGVITSGLYGGYPDNAGVQPGTPGGMNLISPANWPKDVSTVTRYHMGRFKFLNEYCKSVGITPPRIIMTEHGFDDTSDIKAWEETLIKTAPFLNIRGWRTLYEQWKAWFGGIGWSDQRAYFEQLKWANEVIYANSNVEAQCIFCWGHSSQDWEQFDIAGATDLHKLLIEYAKSGTVIQPPPPPPIEEPIPPDMGLEYDIIDYQHRIRSGSGISYPILATVPLGARVRVYLGTPTVYAGGYNWYRVQWGNIIGQMALTQPMFAAQFRLVTQATYTFNAEFVADSEEEASVKYSILSNALLVKGASKVGIYTRK